MYYRMLFVAVVCLPLGTRGVGLERVDRVSVGVVLAIIHMLPVVSVIFFNEVTCTAKPTYA